MSKLQRVISALFLVPFAVSATAGCNGNAGGATKTPPTPAEITQLGNGIKGGDAEVVDHLLSAKPEIVNAKDENGNTPLKLANQSGQQDMVKLITDHGGHE